MKYVFVIGSTCSGLGKGVTSSSIGALLQRLGHHVTCLKIDPYLNIDAGTMSPYEHGEVFVTDDGGETDLDLGNYERFLDINLTKQHNLTTGKVYMSVLERERRGVPEYLGKTIQVIPHVTDTIQEWIKRTAHLPLESKTPTVCMVELGGTVGDVESSVYLEAIRQFIWSAGKENCFVVNVCLIPTISPNTEDSEPKTKPAQHAVVALRSAGITPDVLVCRSTKPLCATTTAKLAKSCMVPPEAVIGVHDVTNIYNVPLLLRQTGVPELIHRHFKLPFPAAPPGLLDWEGFAAQIDFASPEVRIAIVGKYTGLRDSYLSVTNALTHAAIHHGCSVRVVWLDSEQDKLVAKLQEAKVHGVLVPGGFGIRGIAGMLTATQWAREAHIPWFGICLGMQVGVIEWARNVAGYSPEIGSEEFAVEERKEEQQVIVFMPEGDKHVHGGTMRLGSRATRLAPGTLASAVYGGAEMVHERHRHRYEVNPTMIDRLEKSGLRFSGKDAETGSRMEICEQHKGSFLLGVQFHPEFKSRPFRPSPPFAAFVNAALCFTRNN